VAFVGDDEGGRRCSRISSRASVSLPRSLDVASTGPLLYRVLRIRYWRKFDLEVADRRSRYQPRKKCPNRWRSHLLPRMRQFLKRASNGHQ